MRGGGSRRSDEADHQQPKQHSRTWARMRSSFAVVDRPQVDDLLEVAPAAELIFDLEELLVAQRDVLGRQLRIAGA